MSTADPSCLSGHFEHWNHGHFYVAIREWPMQNQPETDFSYLEKNMKRKLFHHLLGTSVDIPIEGSRLTILDSFGFGSCCPKVCSPSASCGW